MIPIDEAADYLTHMLDEAGFDWDRPDALTAWETFKRFARMEIDFRGKRCDGFGVDNEDDGLLFQCGVYSFFGPEVFDFDFTRQFSYYAKDDGKYVGMEQLSCTIHFEPSKELRLVRTTLWNYDCVSLDDFFSRVEALEEFRTVVTSPHRPFGADVEHGAV